MALIAPFKQKSGAAYVTPVVEDTDRVRINNVGRGSGGPAGIYTNGNATTVNIGGGASFTTLTMSQAGNAVTISGDLTVSGTNTTLNTANLDISDDVLLLAEGAASDTHSVFGWERGTTGNDAVVHWNATDDRWEFGFSNGAPAGTLSAASTADLKVDDVTMGTTITVPNNSVTITATGASNDLTLTGLSASTTLNEVGEESIDASIDNTSLIGAINELKTDTTSSKSTYSTDAFTSISANAMVATDGGNSDVREANASADNGQSFAIGVAEAGIGANSSGRVTHTGQAVVQFVGSLTLTEGDEVFLSTSAGRVTNVAPSSTGNVVQPCGWVVDTTGYTGTAGDTATIHLQFGQRFIV